MSDGYLKTWRLGLSNVMGATAIVCGLLTQQSLWWLIPAVAAGITAVALFILFRRQVKDHMEQEALGDREQRTEDE